MDYQKEYRINVLNSNDIFVYANALINAFNIKTEFEYYLNDCQNNFNKGNIFLGAKLISNNNLIGGMCIEKVPLYQNQIYIENLFVDEKYRNNMVATNLINYVINNKSQIYDLIDINLYLYCEYELKSFYMKQNFDVSEEYNDCIAKMKILKMIRNI